MATYSNYNHTVRSSVKIEKNRFQKRRSARLKRERVSISCKRKYNNKKKLVVWCPWRRAVWYKRDEESIAPNRSLFYVILSPHLMSSPFLIFIHLSRILAHSSHLTTTQPRPRKISYRQSSGNYKLFWFIFGRGQYHHLLLFYN